MIREAVEYLYKKENFVSSLLNLLHLKSDVDVLAKSVKKLKTILTPWFNS